MNDMWQMLNRWSGVPEINPCRQWVCTLLPTEQEAVFITCPREKQVLDDGFMFLKYALESFEKEYKKPKKELC